MSACSRGAVVGNAFSGWLVLNVPQVKEGIIVIKIHTWHASGESTITKDWTTENNERVRRRTQVQPQAGGQKRHHKARGLMEVDSNGKSLNFLHEQSAQERQLWASVETPEQPDEFVFEYAINGKITSLSKDEFFAKKQQIQRVVETITILDDENFASEPQDVEIAIRMQGCARQCTFGLTHVYWA